MAPLRVKRLVVGPLSTNCYIVWEEGGSEACVIDPGDEGEAVIKELEELSLAAGVVLCTHGHFDHVGGVRTVVEATGAEFCAPKSDAEFVSRAPVHAKLFGFSAERPPEPNKLLTDGDAIKVGGIELRVLHTPGHTPGSSCFLAEGIAFTGDTLFAGSVGRWDLPGGSYSDLVSSLRKLAALSDETVVRPGHGPPTTIGRERRANLLFATASEEAH